MTVGELRNRMTDKEFIFYAAYFELKAEREKRHIEESKHRTR
tara:strand:+ start:1358 stop:1483 length:126 start_codon:yes stop_codon:yes gene_type:complete